MGTSFIEYKQSGFWSHDCYIESWITTLLEEMKKAATLLAWQEQMIDHWRVQVTIDAGCMSLELNKFLTDSLREQFVLEVAQQALVFSQPVGRKTGELFIKLLEGQLHTDASSPIDYL